MYTIAEHNKFEIHQKHFFTIFYWLKENW
jgi:hypothetical protein